MIRYLIKNNFKIMMRSPLNILMLVVAPLVVIAVLSSAFSALMEKYEGVGSVKAGYRIETDDPGQTALIEALKSAAKEKDITLIEYKDEDPKDVVKKENLGGFVVFGKDFYRVYTSGDLPAEGQILEYMIYAFLENTSLVREQNMTGSDMDGTLVFADGKNDLKVLEPEYMPPIDSSDYYGIIEIVYFAWCAIVCGAGLFSSEKKYRIGKKIAVSDLNGFKQYMAKFIPLVLVVGCGIGIAACLAVGLFGVSWGNPALSALIIFAGIMAAAAFGLMIYSIFDNIVVTIVIVFALVWIWGFIGGSFETYMFTDHSESTMALSPLYYENRALVELCCMGKSDFALKSLLISCGMTVACSGIAILAGTIRKRGKA